MVGSIGEEEACGFYLVGALFFRKKSVCSSFGVRVFCCCSLLLPFICSTALHALIAKGKRNSISGREVASITLQLSSCRPVAKTIPLSLSLSGLQRRGRRRRRRADSQSGNLFLRYIFAPFLFFLPTRHKHGKQASFSGREKHWQQTERDDRERGSIEPPLLLVLQHPERQPGS